MTTLVSAWPNPSLELIFLIFLGVFLGIFIVQFHLYHQFFGYLSNQHPDEWKELGRPKIITNFGARIQISILSKLWNREFERSIDPTLASKARFLWIYVRMSAVIVGLQMAILVILAYVSGWRAG